MFDTYNDKVYTKAKTATMATAVRNNENEKADATGTHIQNDNWLDEAKDEEALYENGEGSMDFFSINLWDLSTSMLL